MRAIKAKIQLRAKPKGRDDGNARDRPGYLAVEAEPDQVPDGEEAVEGVGTVC